MPEEQPLDRQRGAHFHGSIKRRSAIRFNLRQLLIAMSFVGLLCGVFVWLDLNSAERRVRRLKNIKNDDAMTIAFARENLFAKEPVVRFAAAEALGKIGWKAQPALDDLISILETNDEAAPNAAWAIGHIRSSNPRAITALVEALESENHETRRYATYAIWLYGTEASIAIPSLDRHLDDERTAYIAARALGAMGPYATEENIGRISALLLRDEPAERAEACDALSQLAYWHELDAKTTDFIKQLHEDDTDFVRLAAQRASLAIENSALNNPRKIEPSIDR